LAISLLTTYFIAHGYKPAPIKYKPVPIKNFSKILSFDDW
jgi:hypothetical protein